MLGEGLGDRETRPRLLPRITVQPGMAIPARSPSKNVPVSLGGHYIPSPQLQPAHSRMGKNASPKRPTPILPNPMATALV